LFVSSVRQLLHVKKFEKFSTGYQTFLYQTEIALFPGFITALSSLQLLFVVDISMNKKLALRYILEAGPYTSACYCVGGCPIAAKRRHFGEGWVVGDWSLSATAI